MNYREGKVVFLQCFDTKGKETGEFCSLARPALLKGFGDYKEFILQNLTWPEEALRKKIEGSVKVRFKVKKNEMLEDLVVECEQEVLKKAVIELVGYMKEWNRAVSHNRLVDWKDKIEIPFYRNN